MKREESNIAPSTAECPRHAALSDAELLEELRRRIMRTNQTVEELTSLNEELRIVNKKLEESEELKSHFISNITNEIINPFTSILGLSRAILSVDKESWKKVISMVALIHAEAFSLDFQFRNIFFAAKLEAGEARPEVLNSNIRALVEGVVESFRFELRKKRLNLSVVDSLPGRPQDAEPFMFKSDPAYIKLILANLLSNAVNFSYEGGDIEIACALRDNRLVLRVRDYGTGIAPEQLSSIFDRFKRGDNGINSVNRGHGLGLSVSKAVIDLLEGQITVESEPGVGSVFEIQIPEATTPVEGFASEANEIFFDDEEIF